MVKRKPRTHFSVADGAGGMVRVTDERFSPRDWPVQFEVSVQHADHWMRYLHAVCEQRGASVHGLSQHERREDSGTKHIIRGLGLAPLTMVWERKRGGAMIIRARSGADDEAPQLVQAFFDEVNTLCTSRSSARFFRWGCLEYFGRPCRGELWLDETLRLGPPSVQYDKAVYGPRAIVVSAMVDAVSEWDASMVFERSLTELSLFLSVVMSTLVERTDQQPVWTWEIGDDGKTISGVRQLGYVEPRGLTQMPERNLAATVPLYSVARPAMEVRTNMEEELHLPADVCELWEHYKALDTEQRNKFHQVAAKWQEGLMHWKSRPTLSFALMVVACEALKPSELDFDEHTINEVVSVLLGDVVATRLKQDWFRAHYVRSRHFHLGELRGREFQGQPMRDYYDPTFDEARRELTRVTNAAIIEWLRRGGIVVFPTP